MAFIIWPLADHHTNVCYKEFDVPEKCNCPLTLLAIFAALDPYSSYPVTAKWAPLLQSPSGGKRIVFIGGSGKAGHHVIPYLLSKGHKVLNLDLVPFPDPTQMYSPWWLTSPTMDKYSMHSRRIPTCLNMRLHIHLKLQMLLFILVPMLGQLESQTFTYAAISLEKW